MALHHWRQAAPNEGGERAVPERHQGCAERAAGAVVPGGGGVRAHGDQTGPNARTSQAEPAERGRDARAGRVFRLAIDRADPRLAGWPAVHGRRLRPRSTWQAPPSSLQTLGQAENEQRFIRCSSRHCPQQRRSADPAPNHSGISKLPLRLQAITFIGNILSGRFHFAEIVLGLVMRRKFVMNQAPVHYPS